ncbi:MAG: tyrosine-type recombinase/integrase [Myxococcales bacterium]
MNRGIKKTQETTIAEAKHSYEGYLRDEKQNKERSYTATLWRLGVFFPDADLSLSALTLQKCAAFYQALRFRETKYRKPLAVDSQRNILAEAKTFLNWSVGKGYLRTNLLAGVLGTGKRRHGKPQLRIDEARKWQAKAVQFAEEGEEGAVAALVTLVMGLRAGEVVSRIVRDLDDDGRLLWIPDSKTEAGKRTLQVPELLREYLRELAEGKGQSDWLFGYHDRNWPRKWVVRICKAAGVPRVTAHGMRGLHGTLAVETGLSAHAVAAALGHESISTTLQSYAQAGAGAGARQQKVLTVLAGGIQTVTNAA